MKIKGIIFDFNGTLFCDTDLHNKAWDTFLERYNLKYLTKRKIKMQHNMAIYSRWKNEHSVDN